MEEESKALIGAVIHEAAAPYRKVAEVLLGYTFLDEIEEKREQKRIFRLRNRASIAQDALRIVDLRKTEIRPDSIAPEHVEKIMSAGEDISAPELQQVFSRLLAAAMDPDRRPHFRQEYVDIAKQFEPLDALVLEAMASSSVGGVHWNEKIGEKVKRSDDEIFVSALNLEKLGLLQTQAGHRSIHESAYITPKGRQLIKCIAD